MSFLESLRKVLRCRITRVDHDCYDDDDEEEEFEKGKRKSKRDKEGLG